jgi:hypothetical protein
MCYRCAQSVAELISSVGTRRNVYPGEPSNKEPRRKQRGISEGRLKLTTKAAASGGELDPRD